jgi:zinc/manganese transport system substrate-binding protein
MEAIAKAAGVPIVGATETEPAGKNYQSWMSDELDAVDKALPASAAR